MIYSVSYVLRTALPNSEIQYLDEIEEQQRVKIEISQYRGSGKSVWNTVYGKTRIDMTKLVVRMLLSLVGILSVCRLQVASFVLEQSAPEGRGESSLFLRPNQAPELEACAYDLMKEALGRKNLSCKGNPFLNEYFSKPPEELLQALKRVQYKKKTTSPAGPLAWLRAKIFGGKDDCNDNEPSDPITRLRP